MLKASERACVLIHLAKFKTGLFSKRFVANLSIMGDSDNSEGSFYLGTAGADTQIEVWDQIGLLFDDYQQLPFEDTESALNA